MRRSTRLLLAALMMAVLLARATPAYANAQTYVVQWGDTLAKIAQQFGVTADAIQTANALSGAYLFAGQTLVIPTADSELALQSSGGVHVVQPGETLFKIGLKYGLSWVVIKQANNLSGTKIYAGQTLIIPVGGTPSIPGPNPEQAPASSTPPETSAQPSGDGTLVHIVQRGETLFKIGLKYNLRWTVIQAANGLTGTKIYAGQRLIIPTGGASTSAPPPTPESQPEQGNGSNRWFLVDLSEQRLYAYEGDTVVRTTLISSGTAQYPTVVGTYHIYLKFESTRMRGPGYDLPNVPYTMYFYKGYGLHGTYWHNNFGTPMSHGCVNMPTEEARWAYYWADYGTPVTVQW